MMECSLVFNRDIDAALLVEPHLRRHRVHDWMRSWPEKTGREQIRHECQNSSYLDIQLLDDIETVCSLCSQACLDKHPPW